MTMHDGLAERVYVLEAKDEIRRLMAAYVHARDFASSIDKYFMSANDRGTAEALCAQWMPRKKTTCARTPGHSGPYPGVPNPELL